MDNRTPALGELARAHVRDGLEKARVAMPGRVESYDAGSMRAQVTPLVKVPVHGEDGKISWAALPKLFNVPVVMPMGGGHRLTLPVKENDLVLLVFCDFSLDGWKTGDDTPVEPPNAGAHQVADAIAIPGLLSPTGQNLDEVGSNLVAAIAYWADQAQLACVGVLAPLKVPLAGLVTALGYAPGTTQPPPPGSPVLPL